MTKEKIAELEQCIGKWPANMSVAWTLVQDIVNEGYSFGCWQCPAFSSAMRGSLAVFKKGVLPPKLSDQDLFPGMAYNMEEAIIMAATVVLEAETKGLTDAR